MKLFTILLTHHRINMIILSKPLHNIHTEVVMPGSKSYTNRALIMASLTKGKSILHNISESEDSGVLIEALMKLGVKISRSGNTIKIMGTEKLHPYSGKISVGDAGTAMRFLTSICALVAGDIILDGSERMRERPIKVLVDALRNLGAHINYQMEEGYPPIRIKGGGMKGGLVSLDASISSQYFTSLLMIAPTFKKGLIIEVVGDQISKSYIDMTIDGMKHFGIDVMNENFKKYHIKKGNTYKATTYLIEGDASGASYLWGIAALTGGTVIVKNIDPKSAQGDIHFVDILEKMGCRVIRNEKESWISVTGSNKLSPITVDMSSMPDTAQTLAVISAFVPGSTIITGLSTLKIKETNRLQAMHDELLKMGMRTVITNDSITIHGGSPKSAMIETYKDHRMAMAFAVASARLSGMKICDEQVVSKSFPTFWKVLKSFTISSSIQ